jgi:hypothetical protein
MPALTPNFPALTPSQSRVNHAHISKPPCRRTRASPSASPGHPRGRTGHPRASHRRATPRRSAELATQPADRRRSTPPATTPRPALASSAATCYVYDAVIPELEVAVKREVLIRGSHFKLRGAHRHRRRPCVLAFQVRRTSPPQTQAVPNTQNGQRTTDKQLQASSKRQAASSKQRAPARVVQAGAGGVAPAGWAGGGGGGRGRGRGLGLGLGALVTCNSRCFALHCC